MAYAQGSHRLYFLQFAYSTILLLLLLRSRLAPRLRDWVEQQTANRFWQALLVVAALQIPLYASTIPVLAAGHWLGRHFGMSNQGWAAWLGDQVKAEIISVLAEVLLFWVVYAVIRRTGHRWWFYSWLAALPIIVFSAVVNPLIVDPLFFHYTPLNTSRPELVQQIKRVATHSSQNFPESRILLVNASAKYNALNAEVTGLGTSKRVVIWDTLLARMTTEQILFVFGHELGHYALGHMFQSLAFSIGLLLIEIWLASLVCQWALSRYRKVWGVRGLDDWATLPLLMLLSFIFAFCATPAENAFGRYLEHEADQYGLEAVHGIVPDTSLAAREVFQILGEVNLEQESPSWAEKTWFYGHPPLAERIRFASSYDRVGSARFMK